MRPFLGLTFIGAVLAATALLFGFAAPAQAQATDIVYVSNAGQETERGANLSSVEAYGQKFRTGGRAGGYDLKRIEVGITDGGSGLVELMTDSAGLPGTKICDLTVVGGNADGTFNTGTGTVSFDTSACSADQSHLDPNTDYWVAFITVFVMGVTDAVIDSTEKTAEDPGAIAGWSIADRYHAIKNQNDPWSWSGHEHALQISVVGTNTAPTASGGTVDTDEDIAYTFQAANLGFSDDDGDTLDHVTITSLPAPDTGTLTLGGTPITIPQTVTPDQLDGTLDDNLKYTPPANSAGPAFASFKFKVNDGIQDSDESTMTIDLLPVVTAASGLTAINYAENRTDTVDTYSASGSPTWSLTGTDSGQFNMTNGELTFASSPDFAYPSDTDGDNDYEVTVVATITGDDDDSVTGELVVTVSVEEADRAALLALYTDTGGDDDNWRHDTKWNSSSPLGEWYGVTTNDAGRVTKLDLGDNILRGQIPAELGDLTYLEILMLDSNTLSGSIPAELGNLSNLTRLKLAYNGLEGSIPAELGDLSNLEVLSLVNNGLEGSIPAELGDLTNLQELYLDNNSLTGSIPAELGDLTYLEGLSLIGNSLEGSIPAELGDLTYLEGLYLHTNRLEGSIPAELGELTNLESVYLYNNSLTGSIPAALGDLTNLQELELNDNGLTGSIPAALGDLINLTSLALNSNQLTGSIPAALGDLTNLTYLDLQSNSLSESIPTELGDLINLQELYLHINSLTGAIPLEFVNLGKLEYLYVDTGLCVPADTAFQDWLERDYLKFEGNSSNFCTAEPKGLSATQGDDGQTTLSWDDPGNSAISAYQYRQKVGTGAYGSWTDIPESAPGGSNATGFTVTGLRHPSTEYTLELRAVDASGPGLASSVTATTAPNDAPTASHETVSTDEDTAHTFAVAEFGFSDPNPYDKLAHVKITALPGTDQGTLSLDGTDITDVTTPKRVTKNELGGGKLEYTPPANANGTALATFDFKVNDGELDSAESYTITVDVKAVNDPPEATDDSATIKENTAVVIRVLENDSEVDGDGLTLTEVGTPSNGAAMITEDSTTITYTPNTGYVGSDSFSYTVSDGATPPLTAAGLVNVTVTRNVDLSNLTIFGGMLNPAFAADTTSYTIWVSNSVTNMMVTPTTADATAKVTVNGTVVASGDSFDIALSAGAEPTIIVLVTAADGSIDKTYTIKILRGPSVAIATEAAAPVSDPFEVTITFSRAVTGFEQSEITVTNGSVTGFSGSGTSYTAEITPSESGEVTVEVGEDLAEDGAGNGNQSATPLVIEADLTGPKVEITSEATVPVVGAFEVTISFSEAVTGFEQEDVQVSNGSVTSFSGSETSYTAEITPSASGQVTVEVGEDVAEDGAGNGNQAAALFSIEADLKGPEVTITSEATVPVVGAFEVTITFSEPVEGFESEEIEVTNGTVVDFIEVSPSEYQATIKPTVAGPPVVLVVPEDVATDEAGNGNEAAEPFEAETAVEVSYAADSYTATEGGDAVTVTVKLSQAGDGELLIPIQVSRPETTELNDFTVEALEGWDAQEGAGTLTFIPGATELNWRIAANHDGDGDDETVELGFGELPEIAIAGEPAVATVMLEDKGLVELQVSFAQAVYEVKEGQGVDIEMTVSPAADRWVEVPLVVALVGGTTSEDYSGVPSSVVFEEGKSEGTISVELLADEVNDPGEGIVLSLGELPEAVIGGDPSSTEVHFIQYRTAEQFSQSLEVMLAVVARSMGESAQTAIESRFERYRQWSRMEQPGEAMLASNAETLEQPGEAMLASNAETLERMGAGAAASSQSGPDPGRAESLRVSSERLNGATIRSSGELGRPERGATQSWLRNFLLGSLLGSAPSGRTPSGASSAYDMEPSVGGMAQDPLWVSATEEPPLRPGLTDLSERRNPDFNLSDFNMSGVSFEMALAEIEQGNSKSWAPVLWGQGDLQYFNGELTRIGMNYRGGLDAAHLGLDLYADEQMLAGLSLMRSWGNMDYTDDGVDGVLDSRMNTFHPYLYWQPNPRWSVWGIGGMGRGQVEVIEPGRKHNFDADFKMFSAGVRSALKIRDNHELGLNADAFTAQLGTDALEDIAKLRGRAHRARLMLDWLYDKVLPAGQSLSLKLEAGGRFDEGDANRGSGLETGFRLGLLDVNSGLDVALHGRALLAHESDYQDSGVGIQASWDPGEKQRGLRASLSSSWGRDGGGRTTLWDNADAVTHSAGMGTLWLDSQYQMESEVAYAGIKAPGLPGVLTPYSRMRWRGQGRELGLGSMWAPSARSEQPVSPATIELEGRRRERRAGPSELAIMLHVSIPFGGSRAIASSLKHVSARRVTAAEPPAEPVNAPHQDGSPPSEPAMAEPGSLQPSPK